MKQNILISLFLIISSLNSALGQDFIIKKDGTKLEVKVLEISSKEVKYYNFTQPNGPLRILGTHELTEIIYENGEFEKFEVKEPLRQSSDTRIYESGREAPKYSKLDMMGAGFAIDILVGASQLSKKGYNFQNLPEDYWNYQFPQPVNIVDNAFTLSLRISNKFYFDATPKWRTGIQVSYARLGLRIADAGRIKSFIISPMNFGTANVIKLNDRFGLEANMLAGLAIIMDNQGNGIANGYSGFVVNPEVKLRYKVFAVGIDYSRTSDLMNTPRLRLHQVSLTFGVKF